MISIEISIFRSLLFDEEYSRKVYPYLKEDFFEGTQKKLFQIYKELFDQYNSIPSIEAVGIELQKQQIGEAEFSDIVEFVETLVEAKDNLPDRDWLVNETEEYCRDRAIYNAIYSSIEILDDDSGKHDKGVIPELLDEALAVSFDTSIGMSYFEDAARRYSIYTEEENVIRLPLDVLNQFSNGGLRLKSLSAFIGGTNSGKSSLMCFIASELLRQGEDVLYITMEMAEDKIYERVDANLLDVTTDKLKLLKQEEYLGKVEKLKQRTQGNLVVKEYPTVGAHVGHFRHLLKELRQKKKFQPKIVIVDYLNICASSRYRNSSSVNSYSLNKAIAEELRGLAVETNTAIITGTQLNRQGMQADSPDMTATSDSVGIPFTLDWMVAITTDEVLQDNNQQLLHLLKTRWGNKSRAKPKLINVDFDHMRYSDVNELTQTQAQVGQNKPDFSKKKDNKATNEIDWG